MTDIRAKLDELRARLALARSSLRREEEALDILKRKLVSAQEALRILQSCAETLQASAHSRVASIVSRCLKTVFGPEAYDFEIRFEAKRGKTEARCVFLKDGNELDPLTSSGGGVVDVTSFSLRLACLILTVPERRRLLLLDEPMKHLSLEYRPLVASLLLQLAKELQVQFVLTTHHAEFVVGKVIEVD